MLELYLKPVLSKHRGLALGVWGEAGIGKSYTLARVLKNLPCRHLSLHATTTLPALGSVLSKPKKLPFWAETTLEKIKRGEAVNSSDFISALSQSLSGLAPFVLHLEDAHEATTERLGLLNDLAQSVQKLKGVGLLVTSRQEFGQPFRPIKLEPLSKEASDKLLETELNATLPKEALEFIYSKAAGNPLFTLEYLRFLARQGYLWNDGKLWHWRKPEQERMPAVVEALLEQQILQAKATELNRYVLESKAILPLEASDALWQRVARVNPEELNRAIHDLNQHGIFKDNSFAHPLFKEVTLQTLDKDRRQHLARRAIYALEHDPVQAALFVDDAGLENTTTISILERAAENLKEMNPLLAGNNLAKTINLAEDGKKDLLAIEAAKLLQHQDYSQSIRILDDLLNRQPNHVEGIYLYSKLLASQYLQDEAEHMLSRLPQKEKLGLRGIETKIRLQLYFSQTAEVMKFWEEHPEIHKEVSIKFILNILYALNETKRYQEAIDLAQPYLKDTSLNPLDKIPLLGYIGEAYSGISQRGLSEKAFLEAIQCARQIVPVYPRLSGLLHNFSYTQQDHCEYLEAKQLLLESCTLADSVNDYFQRTHSGIELAGVLIELGEYESAEHYLGQARDYLKTRRNTFLSLNLETTTNLLYRSWSQLPQNKILAIKYGHSALNLAKDTDSNPQQALHYLALSEIAQGNTDNAQNLVEKLEKYALKNTSENPYNTYVLPWDKGLILELLGEKDEAKSLLSEACQLAITINNHLYAHKIALELARLNNDLESAREHMQWFSERGLMNGVNIAKRYFPELDQSFASPTLSSTTDSPRLEVLGPMQVNISGNLESIKGRKRKECLALLLNARLSGRSEVKNLEFFDTLYSDENEHDAANNLRGLIRILRELLGNSAIVTTAGGYALGTLQSDAEQFLQSGDTSLWRGVFLEDIDLETHETATESLYLLLHRKAKELLESNPKEAARSGKILLEVDPYNQDYLKLCLEALRASSNHKSLKRLYAEAKQRFTEVGKVLPESWQAFLVS